jgi:hypothetical protein
VQPGVLPDGAQVNYMLRTDNLRRLARRVVDSSELVNELHLEQGPSGRLVVVIKLETADIL